MEIGASQLQYQAIQDDHSSISLISTQLKPISHALGYTIILVLECCLGFHLGIITGWILGWCVGYIGRELYQPIHFISFEVLDKWYYLPHEYGKYGMIGGAVIGILIIFFVTLHTFLKKQIPETDKNGTPEETLS